MKKLLNFIALVPKDNDTRKMYTAYLFEKEEKFVLPIQMTNYQAKCLLENSKKLSATPSVYNTFNRCILSLNAYMKEVIIVNYKDEVLYTYMAVNTGGKVVHINISCPDALILAKHFRVNVYIEKRVLETCGIKVNEKILREALEKDF